MRKRRSSKAIPAILVISLLLFSLPACQSSQTRITKESSSADQVMFAKADKVYIANIDGTSTRKLFAAKYQDALIGFAKYPPSSKTITYEINKMTNPRSATELRTYALDTDRDELVDTDVQVVASNDNGLILYTKLTGVERGKLWLYDVRNGKRCINIINAATGVLDKDSTELFHHSFVPPAGPIPEPQGLYITDLKTGKQELVVTEGTDELVSFFTLKIASDYTVYAKTQGEGGLSNVYSFNRITKKHELIADDVLSFDVLQEQDSIVVARATGNNFNTLQVIEMAFDGTSKRVIANAEIPDSYSGYHAQLVPASSTIILKSTPNELALYNYKTRKLHEVINPKAETANYTHISKDQKNIITVIYPMSRTSDEPHEGLYKIDLKSGKRSLIYEGPPPKGMTTQLQILDIFAMP